MATAAAAAAAAADQGGSMAQPDTAAKIHAEEGTVLGKARPLGQLHQNCGNVTAWQAVQPGIEVKVHICDQAYS
jgi:hypothetical protein